MVIEGMKVGFFPLKKLKKSLRLLVKPIIQDSSLSRVKIFGVEVHTNPAETVFERELALLVALQGESIWKGGLGCS